MIRSFVLCLALIFTACDSGDLSLSRADLIGSWTPTQSVERVWVTSDQDQDVLDPIRPGVGDLRLSGASSDRLQFVRAERVSSGDLSYTVFSHSFFQHPLPDNHSSLSLGESRLDATVWRGGVYTQYELDHNLPPYSLRDNRLTFDAVRLASTSGGTVTVDGWMEFPIRTVRADTETMIEEQTHAIEPGDHLLTRVVFEADGSYRKERDTADGVRVLLPGTWELLDGHRVRLDLVTQLGTRTDIVTVERDGDTLVLSGFNDVCPDAQRSCLGFHEDLFVMERGSLTRVRDEDRTLYRPTR